MENFSPAVRELLLQNPKLPSELRAALHGDMDAKAAFSVFHRWAGRRQTEALFAMGWCFAHGCGTARDEQKAINCYARTEGQTAWDLMEQPDAISEAEDAKMRLYQQCAAFAAWMDEVAAEAAQIPPVRDAAWYCRCAEEKIRQRNRRFLW